MNLPAAAVPVTARAVAAFGIVEAAPAALATLRQEPGPAGGPSLPAGFLRHADEQTVAGLAAVLQAIHTFGLQGQDFSGWGVVAAPRFLGRAAVAAAMEKYHQGGAAAVSPHIIPHRSLHSVSGTISLALQARGPNLGVGGGPGHLGEGLLAALTLPLLDDVPGVWLVLTAWDPEAVPDGEGRLLSPAVCHAVALALIPVGAGGGLQLRLRPPDHGTAMATVPPTVADLGRALSPPGPPSPWCYAVAGGVVLELGGVGRGTAESAFPAPRTRPEILQESRS